MPYRYTTNAKCATCDHDYLSHTINGELSSSGCLQAVNHPRHYFCRCKVFVAKLDEPEVGESLQGTAQSNAANAQSNSLTSLSGIFGGTLGGIAGSVGLGLDGTVQGLYGTYTREINPVDGTILSSSLNDEIERQVKERVAEALALREVRVPSSRKGRKFREDLT